MSALSALLRRMGIMTRIIAQCFVVCSNMPDMLLGSRPYPIGASRCELVFHAVTSLTFLDVPFSSDKDKDQAMECIYVLVINLLYTIWIWDTHCNIDNLSSGSSNMANKE
jgi:hypothetical protein